MAKDRNVTVVVPPAPGPRPAWGAPVRDEKRARLRVRMRPGHRSAVVAGLRVKASDVHDDGWIYLPPIYESDVDGVRAKAENRPEELERAKRKYDEELKRYMEEKAGNRALRDTEQGRILREQLTRQFPGSVEQYYHHNTGHSVLPLIECEVLETGLAPPESDEDRERREFRDQVASLSEALKSKADARIAELEAKVEKLTGLLEDALTAPPSKAGKRSS